MSERKPITALLVAPKDEDTGAVIVVCDDGSSWMHTLHGTSWYELPPIPGTSRALSKKPSN